MKLPLRSFVDPRHTAAFIALALLVGFLAGVAGAGLIAAIDGLTSAISWLEDQLRFGRWLPLLTVPLGLGIAWLIGRRFPEVKGSGVPETTAGLAVRAGYVPTRSIFWKTAATAATLGGGGSAGREGPTVMIGAAIGSSIGRHSGLGEDQIRSLVAAGAGAGIGATFNAPIAGMLFAMEVILGNFAIRHLNAVVIASVTAAVTTKTLVGQEQILSAESHTIGSPTELLLYAGLGVLAALVGVLFLRTFDTVHSKIDLFVARPWLRPIVLGGPVAILIAIEPRLFGTGQSFIQGLVDGSTLETAWWVLLVLAGLKVLATAGTLGSDGSGGHFMPALFIGSTLGAGVAALLAPVWEISTIDTGAFAVVGMAATFAAVARAPLTSILIVFELTGDYGLVLPLMLATSLATLIADRLHRETVYTIPLVSRGIRLLRTSDIDLLDTVRVVQVMSPWSEVVRPGDSTREVQDQLDVHRHHGLPVVDEDEQLVGIITLTDVARTGGPGDEVTAAVAMTPNPVTVTESTPVSRAMERMASLGVGRLPVVADEAPTKLVGMFRRETAVKAYHFALTEATEHELARKRQRLWTRPDAEFFEFHIPGGSKADGAPLKDVQWPQGCTLVAIRRGHAVLVPDGTTVLEAGDIITGFGAADARDRVMERLRAPMEVVGEGEDESG
ncbi:MAG: CBS domain-containing protein [bacterium]|nr:CBS domain-containing protein [bacterium]